MVLQTSVSWLVLLMVFCQSHGIQIRLFPGPGKGLLEVFNNGSWGTVCDDNFHAEEADVVCRQLGFTTTNNGPFSKPGGPGPIWIRYISCTGNENQLDDCLQLRVEQVSGCNHNEDVGVACLNETRVYVYSQNDVEMEGRSYMRLYCDVNDGLLLRRKWTVNGKLLTQTTSRTYGRSANRTFTGNWTCEVLGTGATVLGSNSTLVNVLYPPDEFAQRNLSTIVGDSVNLSHADCNPPPTTYRWRKTGPLSPLILSHTPPTLNNLQIRDAGMYYIEVENEMMFSGSITRGHGIELMSIIIPYAPQIECKREVFINADDNVTLECIIDASPPPSLITWSLFKASSTTVHTGRNTSYHIAKVLDSDIGLYTCTAINSMTDADGNTENGVGTCDIRLSLRATDMTTSSGIDVMTSNVTTTPMTTVLYAVGGGLIAVVLGLAVALIIVVKRQRNSTVKERRSDRMTEMGNVIYQNDEHDYDAITPTTSAK